MYVFYECILCNLCDLCSLCVFVDYMPFKLVSNQIGIHRRPTIKAHAAAGAELIPSHGNSQSMRPRLSPELIAGKSWNEHAEKFFEQMTSLEGVRLPGQRRHTNRQDKGPRQINSELIEKIKSLI